MVARWFLGFALALQVFTAVNAADKADPNLPDLIARWDKAFESSKKNIALVEKIASGKMDTMVNTINGNHKVTNSIKDSIADPETGKKVNITAKVTQTANKAKVAETLAERLSNAKKYAKNVGKASIPVFVGTAAFHGLMQGIGWVMDEGGEVKRLPTAEDPDPASVACSSSNDNCSYAPTLFWIGNREHLGTYSSELSAANAAWKNTGCAPYSPLTKGGDGFWRSGGDCMIGRALSRSNPNYLAGSTKPKNPPVPQAEMEQKINNYFNDPKSPSSKDLLIEQALKPEGKASIMWSDDPSSEQTIFSDHKNTAEKILNSDNPQGEGLTKTTPVITDGTTTETETNTDTTTNTDVNETTTTNPDGSTTTTGSNTSAGSSSTTSTSKLPAFCDYASKLCDWLDWTKEMPEDEEKPEEENINDRGIFNRELDTQFNLEGSCPSDFNFQMTNKYFAGSYTIPLNWLCISFTFIGYALIFLSNCIGMWILYETVTRKELRF